MSIWVHRDNMTEDKVIQIYRECTIIEIQDPYKKMKGYAPIRVLMFDTDPYFKTYYMLPYFVAKKYGYMPNNDKNWRQVIFPYTMPDGTIKYLPEFNATFREYQLEILPEILDYLKKFNSVIIGLPPGWGKTIIAAYLFWMSGLLGIVIMDRIVVKNSWITTFEKTMPHLRLWVVGDNNPAEYDIIICMNERLHLVPAAVKQQVGTLIIDEVHTITTKTQVHTFLLFQPKYIIFESATLEQSGLYKMATVCSGEHGVFKTSTAPYYIFAVKTGIEGEKEYKNGNFIPASLQKSLINDQIRQRMIQMIIYNHIEYRKFIVMQRVTDSIEKMVCNIQNCGITADSLYATKKDYNQSRVLIGTFSKISTGFDEENACKTYYTNPEKSNTALFANSVASKYVFEQSRCRCRCSDKGTESKRKCKQCSGCLANGKCINPPPPVNLLQKLIDEQNGTISLDQMANLNSQRDEDDVYLWVIFLIDDNSNVKSNFRGLLPWFKETNGTVVHVDARRQFTVTGPIKYIPYHMPGIYYRILSEVEYKSLYDEGFYAGNDDEKSKNIISLFDVNTAMYVRHNYYSEFKFCYIITVQKCFLLTYNGQIYNNNGIFYCRHPIFMKNIVAVNTC